MRDFNGLDHFIVGCEKALKASFAASSKAEREYPVTSLDTSSQEELSTSDKKQAAKLMRVNHAGEISAQGLYQGQALTAKDPQTKAKMEESAREEQDHLYWCERRLRELDDRNSYLSPFWYAGSFLIGATAGLAGDKWSLGFVKETEDQVVKHLENHLGKLPDNDKASREIILQMREDEAKHAKSAEEAGAAELPVVVRKGIMPFFSKMMVILSTRI